MGFLIRDDQPLDLHNRERLGLLGPVRSAVAERRGNAGPSKRDKQSQG
jgi:hypothetical protein